MAKAVEDVAGFPGDPGYSDDDWEKYAVESVYEDSGYRIEFKEGVPFFGTFLGSEVKDITDEKTGAIEQAYLLKFHDRNGEACAIFANFALCAAFGVGTEKPAESPVKVGEKVRMTWKGLQDIGNGRTMNRINVDRLVTS